MRIPPHPLAGAERLVILQNPTSSHAADAEERLASLAADSHGQLEIMGITEVSRCETSPDHVGNVALLRSLRPTDAVAVAGGDGTVSDIYAASLEAPSALPLSAFAIGNANDLAHMQYSTRTINDFESILGIGRLAQIHPLRICILPAGGGPADRRAAFGYFGMGFTAQLAETFNTAAHRNRVDNKGEIFRFGIELAEVARQARNLRAFRVGGDTPGRYSEIAVMNGQRMAKKIRSRQRLTVPGACYDQAPGQSIPAIARGVGRLAVGRSNRLALNRSLCYIVQEPGGVMAQIDGETLAIAEGSQVRVSIHSRAVSVTATRPS